MPNYLSGSAGNWGALGGLGNEFSEQVWRLRDNQIRAAQWQQNQALAQQELAQRAVYQQGSLRQGQQQIDFEKQKWIEGQPERAAAMALHSAEARRQAAEAAQLREATQAGGVMGDVMRAMYQTDPRQYPDTYNMLRSIMAQQQPRVAIEAPGSIVKQMTELQAARDPNIQTLMATGTPLFHSLSPGAQLLNLGGDKPSVVADNPKPPTSALSYDQHVQLAIAKAALDAARSKFDTTEENIANVQRVGQQFGSQRPTATGTNQVMRAVNQKTGQRIQSTDGGATWSPVQ